MTSIAQHQEELALQSYPIRHLSRLAFAQGFTLFHYKAPDAIAFVTHPEWHEGILSLMEEGDRLMLSAPNGACDFVVRKREGTLFFHLIQFSIWEV